MRIFLIFLILQLSFLSKALSQEQIDQPLRHPPSLIVLLSTSASESDETSGVYGLEAQANWNFVDSFTLGFHGGVHRQRFKELDINRWAVGLSLNYYFNIHNYLPYVGIKRTYYGSFGKTQDALDCLYCSDVSESYSGGETFATIGSVIHNWVLQVDFRLSNERSSWEESAHDPWGVGASYYHEMNEITEPEYMFHIGYSW